MELTEGQNDAAAELHMTICPNFVVSVSQGDQIILKLHLLVQDSIVEVGVMVKGRP